jgi:dihydroneopterin aldolase
MTAEEPAMNTIFVNELRVETRIGVYAWEQHLPQPLLIDLELALPSAKAFTSDDFGDALDYAAVVRRVQAFAANHPHKLLERFAEALAELLRAEFGSPWVRIRVAKLAPVAGVKRLGVIIERGERG